MKITGKLIILVVFCVLFMGLITGILSISALKDRGKAEISEVRKILLEGKKEKLQEIIQSICSIVEQTDSKEAAKKIVKSIRYGEDQKGYLWINNTDTPFSKMVMHTTAPQLDGKILPKKAIPLMRPPQSLMIRQNSRLLTQII